MRQLNTMFKQESNAPCNNSLFSSPKICSMHEQMTRLYEAARVLKGVEGQSAVARLLNASPQTVKNWETRGVSHAGMIEAQRVIGCSATWIQNEVGDMLADAVDVKASKNASNVTQVPLGTRRIPLVSYVQAGHMTEAVDSYVVGDAGEWMLTDLDLSAHAFALRIKGDSMLPEFREGDTVIIDPAVGPLPGDYVVAKNGDNEATFKKYRPRGINERGDQVFELVPLNEDYPPIRSDLSHVHIIGTMVEHRRYRKR